MKIRASSWAIARTRIWTICLCGTTGAPFCHQLHQIPAPQSGSSTNAQPSTSIYCITPSQWQPMHWQGAGLLWPLQQAYSTVDGVLDRRRCFQGVSLSNLEVFVMSMAREAAAAASFAAGLHNVCALTTCLLHTSRGSGLHDLTEHVLVTHNSPIDTSAHASRSVLNLSGLAWPASSTLTPACTSPLFRKHSAQWTCSD